ncbi:MAG: NAD-dependent epimerase/dehydratase family protein [Dehalococcoidia bacterium]|nr:NAD-dependent epimerase/dehydratase family protein [Dehalococcoidia bacterium]
MFLVTGGLGFIGLHTARGLLDAGEDVVLTQFRVAREPGFIKSEIGKRAFVEQLDVTNKDRLMEIGKKYNITGIAHLAVPALNALTPREDFDVNMLGLMNILEAGKEWDVKRVGLASSTGVYGGVRGPEGKNTEDMLLSLVGGGATGTWKKCFELVGNYYQQRTGLPIVNLRISGIYGPLYHSMSNLPSRLVHAAVKGEAPALRGDTYAEDGGDSCYVKDCGRGIAMLMTADKLNHETYNVSAGYSTTAGQLVSAIQKVVPDFKGDFLKEGANPGGRGNSYLDIARIKSEVGYEPKFTPDQAIADYIGWLRAGNEE